MTKSIIKFQLNSYMPIDEPCIVLYLLFSSFAFFLSFLISILNLPREDYGSRTLKKIQSNSAEGMLNN